MSDQIEFAAYVVKRLKQCGVRHVFGVPGDFNLEFLDFVENEEGIEWVGNANELNAAYAADGYARVKGHLAVIITTYGVGELSALCGIAGSLAERLPVLHIVGAPATPLQKENAILHHTLATPNAFTVYSTMSAPLSCSQALINTLPPITDTVWTEAFDKVLKDVLQQCRPGYVEIPTDAFHHKVSSNGLKTPPPSPHAAPPPEQQVIPASGETSALGPGSHQPGNAPAVEDVAKHVVEEITTRFKNAKKPVILVDVCCGRFGMETTVRKLVEECGIWFYDTPMGKSIVDERHPLYGGCYEGDLSMDFVRKEVESADFVLYCGALKSDFNTGSFSVNIEKNITIELHSFTTTIGYASFPTTDIRQILPLLVQSFKAVGSNRASQVLKGESLEKKIAAGRLQGLPNSFNEKAIEHAWFWPTMGQWFQDTDIVITETGTSSFALPDTALPSHSTYLAQVLWGAIGWSVGACLGAALADKEAGQKRRVVHFVGDGSLALTVQELGTMLKSGVLPYVFVINNDGYEIERWIHGWTAQYNNIQMYDHQLMLPFFAGKNCKTPYESFEVHTPAELTKLLNDPAFQKADKMRVIEVYMPRGDSPRTLRLQAKLTADANAKA